MKTTVFDFSASLSLLVTRSCRFNLDKANAILLIYSAILFRWIARTTVSNYFIGSHNWRVYEKLSACLRTYQKPETDADYPSLKCCQVINEHKRHYFITKGTITVDKESYFFKVLSHFDLLVFSKDIGAGKNTPVVRFVKYALSFGN